MSQGTDNACFTPDLEGGPQEEYSHSSTPSTTHEEVLCKDAATQTDGYPKTLTSWKILMKKRKKNEEEEEKERSSTSTSFSEGEDLHDRDLVVVETRSLGFDASAQTRDALMFRYSDAQVYDMVLAWQVLTLFLPCMWHMILYVADQMTSVAVAVELCSQGERLWCGLTITLLVLPSIAINFYAHEQLIRPDIASVVPLNKWLARTLLVAQLAPHYLIARKVGWCYRAWRAQSWQRNPRQMRKSPKVLWEQARAETDSSKVKWFHSLLESVPQLSLQTYILMVRLEADSKSPSAAGVAVTGSLVASVAVSLTSASAGLASVVSDRAWERVAASAGIFFTLGSRVFVCGSVGSVHPALWFAPLASATLLGFVTKVSESKEETLLAVLPKTHKYLLNAFVIASVCPPFNAVGLFSSVPYVLAGLCFLLLDPGAWLGISVFVFSIVGQVLWLAVGFFVA